jgi:hypothetical protein
MKIVARVKSRAPHGETDSEDVILATQLGKCPRGGSHLLDKVSIPVSGTRDSYQAIKCRKCGSLFELENETTEQKIDEIRWWLFPRR